MNHLSVDHNIALTLFIIVLAEERCGLDNKLTSSLFQRLFQPKLGLIMFLRVVLHLLIIIPADGVVVYSRDSQPSVPRSPRENVRSA